MTHGQLAATVVVGGRRGDHMRKIELMKQQAELMDEQRQIRELLEKQEHILREKQVHSIFFENMIENCVLSYIAIFKTPRNENDFVDFILSVFSNFTNQ